MEEALTRILTPRRSIDIMREIHAAKAKGKPYTIVFVGVNGVGKSTNLSKVAYWLLQNDIKVNSKAAPRQDWHCSENVEHCVVLCCIILCCIVSWEMLCNPNKPPLPKLTVGWVSCHISSPFYCAKVGGVLQQKQLELHLKNRMRMPYRSWWLLVTLSDLVRWSN